MLNLLLNLVAEISYSARPRHSAPPPSSAPICLIADLARPGLHRVRRRESGRTSFPPGSISTFKSTVQAGISQSGLFRKPCQDQPTGVL